MRRSKPRSQSPLAQSRPRVQDASGRRPTRQARCCSVAEPTAAERSAKQPTALEPLARPSSRATARRARAARGSSRPSPSPTSRSRPLEITKIAISSRGEPSVGGGGAARAPHAPPNSRRRNDRRQIAPITSSPGPTCRSRPPEITEIASSSRDEGAVGGGGAVRAPRALPTSRRRDDRHPLVQIT